MQSINNFNCDIWTQQTRQTLRLGEKLQATNAINTRENIPGSSRPGRVPKLEIVAGDPLIDITIAGDVEKNPGPVTSSASSSVTKIKIRQELIPAVNSNELQLGGTTVIPTQIPPMTHLGEFSKNVFALSNMSNDLASHLDTMMFKSEPST